MNAHPAPLLTRSFIDADVSAPLLELTVGALLSQRAAEFPDRNALIATSHDGHEVRLTFAELHREAQYVATAIAAAVPRGAFVALWAPNIAEWPIIQYGAAIAGVVLVSINPLLRSEELAYVIRHSGAHVLIHADRSREYDMAGVVAAVSADFPELKTMSLSERDFWHGDRIDPTVVAQAPTDPFEPVLMVYTSGTTGKPKGVLLRHRSVVNVARFTMEQVGIESGAVTINPLPIFHSGSCVSGTLGSLWLAGTHVLVERFQPRDVLAQMLRERATAMIYVPTMLSALVEEQRGLSDPAPKIRTMIGGAASVPSVLIEAAEKAFGCDVMNVFGQTELAPVLSTTKRGDSREDLLETVGHPLPQVEVKIVDRESGEVVPIGETGEIAARGYQQMIEYFGDPDGTARAIDADGFVLSGDLGVMDARGYIRITGRAKELIIRGGENIAPAEIESALLGHPAVLDVSVVGLPDDRWGETVVAVLRVRGEVTPDLREQLHQYARDKLAPFKTPADWFVAREFPLTTSGKVQKFELVRLVLAGNYSRLP